jgi:hypothetical protein
VDEFETIVRGVRIFGIGASAGYLLFFVTTGFLALFNIHPEFRTLNTIDTVIGAAGFLMGLLAWFPRKQMFLVDRKDFRQAVRGPLVLHRAISWRDGKILVIKTHALVAVALSLVIFGVLVIMTLAAYS